MDALIADTAKRIYTDHAEDTSGLWHALEENGLSRAWIPDDLGGTGLELSDGFALIRQSAGELASVPFAETLMAGYLLATTGAEMPDGQITVASSTENSTSVVPFTDNAEHVIRLHQNNLEIFKIENAETINNVGSDPLATIDFSQLTPVSTHKAPDWLTPEVYQQLGAVIRTAQLCGAMQYQLELTLEHTSTREQFGRPLTKFQAIQHLLAEMAGELATSSAALEGAIQTVNFDAAPDEIAVACAKARASEAADIVARHAHQAHGAIGYTGEYSLGQFSRRLWQWREDFGNEFYWSKQIGRQFSRTDSGGLTEDIFGAING